LENRAVIMATLLKLINIFNSISFAEVNKFILKIQNHKTYEQKK
jgi:hypothetical protein